MAHPVRRTARLPFGRLSEPGARYFVTFCTKGREQVLSEPEVAVTVKNVLESMHQQQDIDLIAATLMPDHGHLLFALGDHLAVGQVLGKIKALARRSCRAEWQWQQESFEHRVRFNDSVEDYGFYIFMNPYRAGLCPLDRHWACWLCPDPRRLGFLSLLDSDAVVPTEWIERSRMVGASLGISRRNGPSTSDGPTQGSSD